MVLEQKPAAWSGVLAGARFILHHPILRSFLASLAAFNFFSYMIRALYVLYVLSVLGVSPVLLGVIYAAGSIGFPLGALLAGPVARRQGTGPTIMWGAGLSNAAYLLILLSHGSLVFVVSVLIVAQFLVSFPSAITAINQSSLRQGLTPNEMRGRTNGASLFLASGLGTVGGLIAGLSGQILGLQNTLIIAVVGIQSGTLILLISPFRRFREPPSTQ